MRECIFDTLSTQHMKMKLNVRVAIFVLCTSDGSIIITYVLFENLNIWPKVVLVLCVRLFKSIIAMGDSNQLNYSPQVLSISIFVDYY